MFDVFVDTCAVERVLVNHDYLWSHKKLFSKIQCVNFGLYFSLFWIRKERKTKNIDNEREKRNEKVRNEEIVNQEEITFCTPLLPIEFHANQNRNRLRRYAAQPALSHM